MENRIPHSRGRGRTDLCRKRHDRPTDLTLTRTSSLLEVEIKYETCKTYEVIK